MHADQHHSLAVHHHGINCRERHTAVRRSLACSFWTVIWRATVSGGVAGFTIPQAIVVTVQLSGLLANGLSLWFVGLVVVPIIVRLVLLAMRPPMRPACAR